MVDTKTKKKNILASGLSLSFFTLISRILGLIREITKAALMGTSQLSDAFGVAFMLPNLFRRLFAENSISVAFIPTFRSYLDDDKKEKSEIQTFLSATLSLVSLATTITVILGIIFAPQMAVLFSKHNSADIISETALLTRIMFPYLFVISIAAFFQGILNAHHIFSPSGFTPILFNIIVIASSYLLIDYAGNPARAMAIGVILGGTVQALFQLPFVLKQGWKISLTGLKKTLSNPGTKRVLRLIAPTIIGMAAYQLNDFVSSIIAKNTGIGILSSIQYSLRLQELILGIFAVTVGTIILPDLSSLAKREKWQDYNKMLLSALKLIALITIPITFFSILFRENLIILIYKTNQFSDESVALTSGVFFFHIIGLFCIAANRILSPAFYAQSNAKLPTYAGIIGFACNIILALILSRSMGGNGIALALSIASFINSIALLFFLHRLSHMQAVFLTKQIIGYTIKLALLSLIAIAPVYLIKNRLLSIFSGYNKLIAQAVPMAIATLIFFSLGILLLLLTKDSLLLSIAKKIKQKIFQNGR